jgi:hypothetical protein
LWLPLGLLVGLGSLALCFLARTFSCVGTAKLKGRLACSSSGFWGPHEAEELQQVVGCADQFPLGLHVVQTAQAEAAEATHLGRATSIRLLSREILMEPNVKRSSSVRDSINSSPQTIRQSRKVWMILGRGVIKAWKFVENLYPCNLLYLRLIGDYTSSNAIDDFGVDAPGRTMSQVWTYARDTKVRVAVLVRAKVVANSVTNSAS